MTPLGSSRSRLVAAVALVEAPVVWWASVAADQRVVLGGDVIAQ